jgi:hypothetical protein
VVFVNGIEQQNHHQTQQQERQRAARRGWTPQEEGRTAGARVHAPLSLSDVERVDWSQQLLTARFAARVCADPKASTDPLSYEVL